MQIPNTRGFHDDLDNNLNQRPSGMFQPRTISTGGALFPLSIVGLALLIVAPAVVRAQRAASDTSNYKGFSGLWVRNDSVKQVYYHDQTVAVVELGPGKTLENCELIEVMNEMEVEHTLNSLRVNSEPINITFPEMFHLMDQCDAILSPFKTFENSESNQRVTQSVFQGIVPGTKWCGNSDIARTYFDLGKEKEVDKCCRSHDLCPVKVRSYRTRYNLKNENFYTKSHCDCDSRFLHCLKNYNSPLANLMGNVYFNILRVPCVEDSNAICNESLCNKTRKFRLARQFS